VYLKKILGWFSFFVANIFFYRRLYGTKLGGMVLATLLRNMGVVGVKVGQHLYSRTDIMKPCALVYLEPFLSFSKTSRYEDVCRMIKDESLIVDPMVVASGSIGQVHLCRIRGDVEVYVLKILHPNVVDEIQNDIKLLRGFVWFFGMMYRKVQVFDFDKIFSMIEIQTDMIQEYDNLCKASKNFKHCPHVSICRPILRTSSYIVMERMRGILLSEYLKDCTQEDSQRIRSLVYAAYLKMTFKDKFNHLDLHHGNILVENLNKIQIIDWGLAKRMDRRSRDGMLAFLRAYAYRTLDDTKKMLRCILIKESKNIGDCAADIYHQTKMVHKNNMNKTLDTMCCCIYEHNLRIDSEILNYINQFTHFMNPRKDEDNTQEDNLTYQTHQFIQRDAYWAGQIGYVVHKLSNIHTDLMKQKQLTSTT